MELTDNLSCLGTIVTYNEVIRRELAINTTSKGEHSAEFNAIPIVFYLILCLKKKIQH